MTYVLESKINAELISLSDMKAYLKVDDSSDDQLIESLIKSAINIAERFMNRDILTATWVNYRDCFIQDLTLRKGAFQSIVAIEYLKDSVYTTLASSEYQSSIGGVYGEICSVNVPSDIDMACNSVKITFKTGFGDTVESVPIEIITAILMMVSHMYFNRGDCQPERATASAPEIGIPSVAKAILKAFKIVSPGIYY